jgi:hypothetical protein
LHIKQQADLGLRWVTLGWRLFRRSPWLLGGMGLCSAVPIGLLLSVPFVGAPAVALLAPIFLASTYLVIDRFVNQKSPPRPVKVRRVAALRQSPRELVGVLRDEDRLIPMALFCLYSMGVVVLISVVVLLVAGNAWSVAWSVLDAAARLRVLAAMSLALAFYLLLAASLIYALPLVLLQKLPLVPAVARSLGASWRHGVALSVLCGFLLLPLAVVSVASHVSFAAGCLLGVATAVIVLPVTGAGLYGSYRTIFANR